MKGFYDRKNLDLDASSYFFISLLQQITILGGYLVAAYLVVVVSPHKYSWSRYK